MTHITVDTARTRPLVERLRGVFDHLQVCGFLAGGIPDLLTQKGNCLLTDLAALLSPEGGEQAAQGPAQKPQKTATNDGAAGIESPTQQAGVTDTRSPGHRLRDSKGLNTTWGSLSPLIQVAWERLATRDTTQPPQPPAEAGVGAGEADGCGETLEGLRERVEALERQVHELTRTEHPVAVLARVRALGEGL